MWWFPFLDPHLCNFLPWPTSVWRIHWGGDEELSDLECFIRIRTISFVIWFLLSSLDKWIGKVWKEGILKWIFLYSKWGNFLVILKGLPACSKKLLLSQSSPFFVPFPIQRFQAATNSSPKATLRLSCQNSTCFAAVKLKKNDKSQLHDNSVDHQMWVWSSQHSSREWSGAAAAAEEVDPSFHSSKWKVLHFAALN